MLEECAEGDLVFSFDNPHSVVRFDDDNTHGMAHAMKRIDFIVTFAHRTWLIEVKDPESRNIPPHRTTAELENFRKKLDSETLYALELAPKLKDTLVYLALDHQAPRNDISYIAFVQVSSLDAAMLLTAQNKLKKLCYLPGPKGKGWSSKFNVIVLNMDAWNSKLAPHSVRRRT